MYFTDIYYIALVVYKHKLHTLNPTPWATSARRHKINNKGLVFD